MAAEMLYIGTLEAVSEGDAHAPRVLAEHIPLLLACEYQRSGRSGQPAPLYPELGSAAAPGGAAPSVATLSSIGSMPD